LHDISKAQSQNISSFNPINSKDELKDKREEFDTEDISRDCTSTPLEDWDVVSESSDESLSSDDEDWDYVPHEQKDCQKAEKSESNTKTLRKNKKIGRQDVIKKEREILEEILRKDLEKIPRDNIGYDSRGVTSLKDIGDNVIAQSIDDFIAASSPVQTLIKEKKTKPIPKVYSKAQEVTLDWDIKLMNTWSEEKVDKLEVEDSEMTITLPKMCPGSYEFQFLINGCPFCDESLPHKQSWPLGLPVNTVQVWPGCSPKVKVAPTIFIPWEVEVKGEWSQEPILCKVSKSGSLSFPVPSLQPGEHVFHFLINGCRFTDSSRPTDMVEQDYFLSHNVLRVDSHTGDISI